MVNMSFNQGHFPKSQKHAIVGPRIKTLSLDPTDLKSYRPVSNITFILKLIERIALNRLSVHSGLFRLLPARQLAYRRFHSTDSAVAIVHNDIVRATDAGLITALVLLDLSAAVDIQDHGILLDVLPSRFGVTDRVFEWIQSYLTSQTQVLSTGSDYSEVTLIACSVPRGSVVRPLLFIADTEDLEDTISRFTFNHHMYADDTQLSLKDVQYVRSVLERCIFAIQYWCSSRRLQLNLDKI